jgi:hypothetical protein
LKQKPWGRPQGMPLLLDCLKNKKKKIASKSSVKSGYFSTAYLRHPVKNNRLFWLSPRIQFYFLLLIVLESAQGFFLEY